MRIRLTGPVILAAVWLSTSGYALSPPAPPPLPEDELDNAQLPRDVDHLIDYLERGIPIDHVFPARSLVGTPSRSLLRLYYLPFVIPALANLNDPRALDVLRRVQAGELPDVVNADLDLGVAARTQYPSWEEWDIVRALERDRLRMEATVAITRLTGEKSDGLFRQLLMDWASKSAAEKDNPEIRRAIIGSLFGICDSLLYADVVMGIETLLLLVESSDPELQWAAAGYLYRLTSQEFGPYYDTPFSATSHEAQKWRDWWSKQRPAATDLRSFVRAASQSRVVFQPTTLRDYLVEIVDHAMTEWEPGHHPEDWMKAYAPKHFDELNDIAQDPQERLSIRAEALEYIVQFHPKASFKAILSALYDPAVAQSTSLHDKAVELLYRHHPNEFDETIITCIDEDCPSATMAIQHLWIKGGRYTLAAKLSNLDPSLRKYALDKLLYDSGPPEEALELALAGDNPEFAARAVKAARHPAIKALLTPKGLAHLERWEQDPWCRYWLLVRTPKSDTPQDYYTAAMNAQQDEVPPAGAVYAFIAHRTGDAQAVEGFIRCVETYRASRGRPQPLADLGYRFIDTPMARVEDKP